MARLATTAQRPYPVAAALLARAVEILGTELQCESAVSPCWSILRRRCRTHFGNVPRRSNSRTTLVPSRMPQAKAPRTIRARKATLNTTEFSVRISLRTVDTLAIRAVDDLD
jgi:hypothetical protein